MCGIAGIFAPGAHSAAMAPVLRPMIAALEHRGPDGTGFYFDRGLGLGHARLSIIDLEGGKQPLANEDGSVRVTFNGEVFNYRELRAGLRRRGHVFSTDSDTEVLVHLYEDHGERFVEHLNGQFALALWDVRRRKLILARDRVGIAPLFYTREDGRLLFASEIKALLAAADHAPALNRRAIDQLFTYWAPLSPETVFEGVHEVPPGEMLIVEEGRIRRRRYWEWTYPRHGDYLEGSEQELAERLHHLLVDATRLRLRADVPVGAYLSGGLDSSVITALIHHHGDVPLQTFSIGFGQSAYDEGEYQQEMVAHLGASDSRVQCRDTDIADTFLDVIRHAESPVLRTAPAPMRMLSARVRQEGYRVVLTGEGADEVLGGYDIFKEAKIRSFWARNPESQIRPALLKRLYPYLSATQMQSLPYLKQFFGAGLEQPDAFCFSHIPRWVTTARCKEFFSREMKATLADDAVAAAENIMPPEASGWHSFARAQFLEARILMPRYLLSSQGDRMLMANSVEGRFPFLDHRLIEFANRLPPQVKMRGLTEKYLLKKAAGRYLPASITARHKQPYRAPDIPAFFSKRIDYLDDLLSTEKLRRYGYFDAEKVDLLLRKITRGKAIGYKDNMALVGILSTQAWHYLFVERFERERLWAA